MIIFKGRYANSIFACFHLQVIHTKVWEPLSQNFRKLLKENCKFHPKASEESKLTQLIKCSERSSAKNRPVLQEKLFFFFFWFEAWAKSLHHEKPRRSSIHWVSRPWMEGWPGHGKRPGSLDSIHLQGLPFRTVLCLSSRGVQYASCLQVHSGLVGTSRDSLSLMWLWRKVAQETCSHGMGQRMTLTTDAESMRCSHRRCRGATLVYVPGTTILQVCLKHGTSTNSFSSFSSTPFRYLIKCYISFLPGHFLNKSKFDT